jgi:hypothetical protein
LVGCTVTSKQFSSITRLDMVLAMSSLANKSKK